MPPNITTRRATPDDATAMADILNPIIRAGGTTALEHELTVDDIRGFTFDDPALICIHVAVDDGGRVAGFQWLSRFAGDPLGFGDIATFARQAPKLPGTGRALLRATLRVARAAGLTAITARIRADNAGGLAYYNRMGFRDHDVVRGVPLRDGTPVDRITKLFTL